MSAKPECGWQQGASSSQYGLDGELQSASFCCDRALPCSVKSLQMRQGLFVASTDLKTHQLRFLQVYPPQQNCCHTSKDLASVAIAEYQRSCRIEVGSMKLPLSCTNPRLTPCIVRLYQVCG